MKTKLNKKTRVNYVNEKTGLTKKLLGELTNSNLNYYYEIASELYDNKRKTRLSKNSLYNIAKDNNIKGITKKIKINDLRKIIFNHKIKSYNNAMDDLENYIKEIKSKDKRSEVPDFIKKYENDIFNKFNDDFEKYLKDIKGEEKKLEVPKFIEETIETINNKKYREELKKLRVVKSNGYFRQRTPGVSSLSEAKENKLIEFFNYNIGEYIINFIDLVKDNNKVTEIDFLLTEAYSTNDSGAAINIFYDDSIDKNYSIKPLQYVAITKIIYDNNTKKLTISYEQNDHIEKQNHYEIYVNNITYEELNIDIINTLFGNKMSIYGGSYWFLSSFSGIIVNSYTEKDNHEFIDKIINNVRAFSYSTLTTYHKLCDKSTSKNMICIYETYCFFYKEELFPNKDNKNLKPIKHKIKDALKTESKEIQNYVELGEISNFLKEKSKDEKHSIMYLEMFDKKFIAKTRFIKFDNGVASLVEDEKEVTGKHIFIYHKGHVSPRKMILENMFNDEYEVNKETKIFEKKIYNEDQKLDKYREEGKKKLNHVFSIKPNILDMSKRSIESEHEKIGGVIAWDFETYGSDGGKQIPFCLSLVGHIKTKIGYKGKGKNRSIEYREDKINETFYGNETYLMDKFVEFVKKVYTEINDSKTSPGYSIPKLILYTFNGSRYDNLFVFDRFRKEFPFMKYTIAGSSSVKRMSIHNCIFNDMALIYPGSLSKVAQSFKLSIKKSYFPYKFVNKDNINYIGEIPDKKYWNENDYEKFWETVVIGNVEKILDELNHKISRNSRYIIEELDRIMGDLLYFIECVENNRDTHNKNYPYEYYKFNFGDISYIEKIKKIKDKINEVGEYIKTKDSKSKHVGEGRIRVCKSYLDDCIRDIDEHNENLKKKSIIEKNIKKMKENINPKLYKYDLKKECTEYCEMDCKVLYGIAKKHINNSIYIVEQDGNKRLVNTSMCGTGASIAKKTFEQGFLDREIYASPDKQSKYYGNPEDRARKSFSGGRTEVFKKEFVRQTNKNSIIKNKFDKYSHKKLSYVDINSSYPASMMKEVPVAYQGTNYLGGEFNKSNIDHVRELTLYGISKFTLNSTCNDKEIPFLHIKSKKGDFVFLKDYDSSKCDGELQYIWGYQIKNTLQKLDYTIEYKLCDHYIGSAIFSNYINYQYNKRLEAKRNGDGALSEYCKLLMNSLYGKFAQRQYESKIIIDKDNLQEYSLMVSNPDFLVTGYEDIDYEGTIIVKYFDLRQQETNPGALVRISSYISMLSRCNLHDFMYACTNNGQDWDNVYYCDTDSLFTTADLESPTIKPFIHQSELGKWKVEEYCGKVLNDIDTAYFAAPKLYYYNQDNITVNKSKGVRESDIKTNMKEYDIQGKNLYKDLVDGVSIEVKNDSLFKRSLNSVSIIEQTRTIKAVLNKRKFIDNESYCMTYDEWYRNKYE